MLDHPDKIMKTLVSNRDVTNRIPLCVCALASALAQDCWHQHQRPGTRLETYVAQGLHGHALTKFFAVSYTL